MYSDPGSPLSRRTQFGTYAVARITPDPVTLETLREAAAAAAATDTAAADAAATALPGAAAAPRRPVVTSGGLASGDGTWLLMSGSGASPQGNRPFLDLMHLETGGLEWRGGLAGRQEA